MNGAPRRCLLALALVSTLTARAGEIDIVGFSAGTGLQFQGGTVGNFYTLEFAPSLDGPWTNWGSVSSASITGTVMSLPFPFFYRIVETPERAFPPYATGTPVYVEADAAALAALDDLAKAAAAAYQPRGDYATGTPVYVETDAAALAALAGYETAAHAAAAYQPRGTGLTNGQSAPVSLGTLTITAGGKVGIGQTNPVATLSVGNLSYPSFQDFMIASARAVDDTKAGTTGHAFLDGSSVDRRGKVAYFSFESHAECIGTNAYSEIVSFRNANAYSTSGTVDIASSFDCFPRVERGVVKYLIGLYVHPFYKATSGTGIVERQYGVYVQALTNAALENYAFFSAGATPSRFGQIVLGTNAAISNWPAGGGTLTGVTFNGVAAEVAGGNASLSSAPASIVVSENYTVQAGDGAVGADTSGGDIAVTLPDLADRFHSVLIRKFSGSNTLAIRQGTNTLETLSDDGESRVYDWWPDRAGWFRRD